MNKKELVIEVDSIKDKEIFIIIFNYIIKTANLEKIGLKIEEPRRIEPMIIIYDVEKEYNPEELKEKLILKNIDGIGEEDFEELCRKIHFRRGFSTNNPNRLNWVVQMDDKICRHQIAKKRVYMNWRSHNIKEYINVIRCFKYHGYGHIAKFCNQDELCETCGEKGHKHNTNNKLC